MKSVFLSRHDFSLCVNKNDAVVVCLYLVCVCACVYLTPKNMASKSFTSKHDEQDNEVYFAQFNTKTNKISRQKNDISVCYFSFQNTID